MASEKEREDIDSKGREIVVNVSTYFKESLPHSKTQEIKGIVTKATDVSIRTVDEIVEERKTPTDHNKPLFATPPKWLR
ncbi:hypothetical protein Trydic_g20729 [Trypoxylus dichotomus]